MAYFVDKKWMNRQDAEDAKKEVLEEPSAERHQSASSEPHEPGVLGALAVPPSQHTWICTQVCWVQIPFCRPDAQLVARVVGKKWVNPQDVEDAKKEEPVPPARGFTWVRCEAER